MGRTAVSSVMAETHSRACQLRWVAATWALTLLMLLLYLIWLDRSPSFVAGDVIIAVFGVGTSLVAVGVLARLPYLAAVLVATPVAGFVAGYTWALITYGSGAEDGTVWRGYGGAILGAASAISAWLVLRLAHRFLSRGTCPTTS
jgi:hypothetical protein